MEEEDEGEEDVEEDVAVAADVSRRNIAAALASTAVMTTPEAKGGNTRIRRPTIPRDEEGDALLGEATGFGSANSPEPPAPPLRLSNIRRLLSAGSAGKSS